MTDQHLVILLRNYRRQLEDAIDAVRQMLPEDSVRHDQNHEVGLLRYEVRNDGDYVILDPLHVLVTRLYEDIATLETTEAANGQ